MPYQVPRDSLCHPANVIQYQSQYLNGILIGSVHKSISVGGIRHSKLIVTVSATDVMICGHVKSQCLTVICLGRIALMLNIPRRNLTSIQILASALHPVICESEKGFDKDVSLTSYGSNFIDSELHSRINFRYSTESSFALASIIDSTSLHKILVAVRRHTGLTLIESRCVLELKSSFDVVDGYTARLSEHVKSDVILSISLKSYRSDVSKRCETVPDQFCYF